MPPGRQGEMILSTASRRRGDAFLRSRDDPAFGGQMSRLVVVVPLKEGARARARALLDAGPPFELGDTAFDRHDVFLTEREVVFVFEAPGEATTLELPADDPELWKAAAAWRECLAGRQRKAEVAFSWERAGGE
jgi:hypothetical protein